MTDPQGPLVAALQRQVALLVEDMRTTVDSDPEMNAHWRLLHRARCNQPTGDWRAWVEGRITEAAVAWVLLAAFARFCRDNGLSEPGDRLAGLPATVAITRMPALYYVAPSAATAAALDAVWNAHDLTDPALDTGFLGDLYQHLSAKARQENALLQTPTFVANFILDRTMDPALAERPLEGFRMIDPACGPGRFLVLAFTRLLERWDREAPHLERQVRVQLALDSVTGVDIDPVCVAIARFRLTVAALRACGIRRLAEAPAFRLHLAVGDSLLPADHPLQPHRRAGGEHRGE